MGPFCAIMRTSIEGLFLCSFSYLRSASGRGPFIFGIGFDILEVTTSKVRKTFDILDVFKPYPRFT